MINRQASESRQRPDEQSVAAGRIAFRVLESEGIGRIELAHPMAGYRNVRIPWEGHHAGSAAIRRDVQHHHGVGVRRAGVRGGCEVGEFGRSGTVPAVVPDDQDVLILAIEILTGRARGRAGGGSRRDRVDADDLGGERTIAGPGPAAADQHGHGKHAADDSGSGADLPPPPLGSLCASPLAHVRAPGRGPTCPPTAT